MADIDGKIYTKKGDTGEAHLLSGEGIAKDSPRVKAYGCLDELQSHLGMARSLVSQQRLRAIIETVQQDIFVAASELASTSQGLSQLQRRIGPRDTARLESQIDELTGRYGLPVHFVVPGRSVESSALHIARSVCRRSERLIIGLNRQVPDYAELLIYFNRLSDLLFVLAWATEVRAVVEQTVRDLFHDVPPAPADHSPRVDLPPPSGGRAPGEKNRMKIPYLLAQQLVAVAQEKAEALDVPMVIAVTDAAGTLLCFAHMDGALLAGTELAVSKAYTAAALRMATHELNRLAQPGGTLYGIQDTHQGRIVLLGGGLPLWLQEQVAGAIGVSGGTVEQDIQVAQCAVEALQEMAAWAVSIGEAVPMDGSWKLPSLRNLTVRLLDALKTLNASFSDHVVTVLTGAIVLAYRGKAEARRP